MGGPQSREVRVQSRHLPARLEIDLLSHVVIRGREEPGFERLVETEQAVEQRAVFAAAGSRTTQVERAFGLPMQLGGCRSKGVEHEASGRRGIDPGGASLVDQIWLLRFRFFRPIAAPNADQSKQNLTSGP